MRSTEALKKKHKKKIEKVCSEQEAATKWTPGKGELEELRGAHVALELDQQECPDSCSSVDRAHRGSQVVAVDMVVRGCRTSIVKRKGCRKLGH